MSQQSSSHHQQEKDLTESHHDSFRAEQSTTPQARPEILNYFAAAARSSPPYVSPYAQRAGTEADFTAPLSQFQRTSGPSSSLNPGLSHLPFIEYPVAASMSTYSSSSSSSSIYDSPNPQKYRGTIGLMSNPKQISSVSISSVPPHLRR